MLKTTLGRAVVGVGILAGGGAAFWYTADVQTKFDLVSNLGPVVRLLDAEDAHNVGLWAASNGWFPRETRPDPLSLRTTVWGRTFANPIGLAAGFDKDADAVEALMGLGFGFVEIGSVTPKPQPGNPQPRVFRIPELKAIINRYGFNSAGSDVVEERLVELWGKSLRDPNAKPGVLGVNLGKNKMSTNAGQDYSILITRLAPLADYIVINVSSPNTPGLRALQGRQQLEELVTQVKGTRDRMVWGKLGPPPLLIKIAPDLTELDLMDVAAVALRHNVDGLVVSNTTITRPGGVAALPVAHETGGLSGPPLFELSTRILSDVYRLTGGKIPLVGVGGVSSGEDAYKKIRAGASLVQLYTAFAYGGPALVPRIKAELAACLKRDGFTSVAQAVGADCPKPQPVVVEPVVKPKKGWLW